MSFCSKRTAPIRRMIESSLGKNPDDVPFGLLYLADASGVHASLQEAVRVPHEGALLAPRSVDLLADGAAGSVWPLSDVFASKQPQRIPVRRFEGLPEGPAGQPVAEAIILPVVPRIQEKPVGLLICGLNPTRRCDA